eukprot:m51a1_g9200 putative inositol-3-phosphate synthase (531) ;mRNA; r:107076-108810
MPLDKQTVAKLIQADTTGAKVLVASPNVEYTPTDITTHYVYESTVIEKHDGRVVAAPVKTDVVFRTSRKLPRLGLMMVGLAGNNGTTLTAGLLANKMGLEWNVRTGVQKANYFGSMTQCSTVRLGSTADGEEVWVPIKDIVPMVNPNEIVVGGWDINNADLATAARRACVLDYELQRKLEPYLSKIKPLPSVYFPDFIAANQSERANNVLTGTKQQQLEHLRKDIQAFKESNVLDQVVVLWTATTERYSQLIDGLNDTADNLLAAIARNEAEISQSTMFAVASALEGCTFINGSPQNALVPGAIDLATRQHTFVAGDDFKTGQTKIKSVLADFLIGAGIKMRSIVSYNHLGNNDGRNLSAPAQFRSKEISKAGVVEDVVDSARGLLYAPGEHPDHVIVIKYVPAVGDSKRALDEYESEIFLGGRNTISLHNVCEDSLLAAPVMLDLVIMAELSSRIHYRAPSSDKWDTMEPVLSLLSYLLKAPEVPKGTPVVNALARQRECIENVLRALVGLAPNNNMLLECKTKGLVLA